MGACTSIPRESDNINILLPAPMLEKIFQLLSPPDLRTVVLVCRRWRKVGEGPRMWPWVTVTVTRENSAMVYTVLARRRFQDAVISWQHLE